MTDDDVSQLKRTEKTLHKLTTTLDRIDADNATIRGNISDIRSDLSSTQGAFTAIKTIMDQTISDDSRHARRASNLVTVFVVCFTTLFTGIVAIGFFNYQQTTKEVERTLSDVKQKASDLLKIPSLDSAYVRSDNNNIELIIFNATVARNDVGYDLKIYTNFDVYGKKKDGQYGIGKLIGMRLRFQGPIVAEMKTTPLGIDDVAEKYLTDGMDWIENTNTLFVYLTNLGSVNYTFSFTMNRGSCTDVQNTITEMITDNNSFVFATPRLDSLFSPPEEKQLHIKMTRIVGAKKCEQL